MSQARLGHYSNPALGQPTADSSAAVERTTPPTPRAQLPRRLQTIEVDEMVAAYLAGDTVNDLAQRFGVHRTTVMAHLTRRAAKRPEISTVKWDDETLVAAAHLYTSGASLSRVGERFGVHASTIANRFQRAGVPIRPRRGWP